LYNISKLIFLQLHKKHPEQTAPQQWSKCYITFTFKQNTEKNSSRIVQDLNKKLGKYDTKKVKMMHCV